LCAKGVGAGSDGVSPVFVLGQSSQTRVCTQVAWAWLIFPAVLLLLTMVLLGVIGIKTLVGRDKSPVWKNSILPLLFSGPGGWRAKRGELRDINEEAGKMVVRLGREGEGWEFVREEGEARKEAINLKGGIVDEREI